MNYTAIDSHCHMQLTAYDADREAVINDCLSRGIGLIVVGTNKETSTAAVRLAESYPDGVWASIAVHPGHVHEPHHDAQELTLPPKEEFFDEEYFTKLAASSKVVAIGETGLDYYHLAVGGENSFAKIKKKQKDNFSAHIDFAQKHKLPMIMHLRDNGNGEAYADAFNILRRSSGLPITGVMHCFGGSLRDAKQCFELGLFLGVGGIATFPPRKGQAKNPLDDIVRQTPADKLLIETDAPYISPAPFRGERNNPANVLIIAQKVAMLRGDSLENILKITTNNAICLFNLASAHTP